MLLRLIKHLQPADGLTILPDTAGCLAAAKEQRHNTLGDPTCLRGLALRRQAIFPPVDPLTEWCGPRFIALPAPAAGWIA